MYYRVRKFRLSICSAKEEKNFQILKKDTLKWGETKFSKMDCASKRGKPIKILSKIWRRGLIYKGTK